MNHQKNLHRIWVKLKPISQWYFLVAFVVASLLCVYGLRQNNLRVIQLRENVTAADKQDGDVEAALRTLRTFVYGHMNTNLSSGRNTIKPPIQLKYRYERLVQAEKDRVAALNAEIQAECTRSYPADTSRTNCVKTQTQSRGAVERPIPDALYKFDFLPPVWSPDLAGFSLVVAVLALLLFAIRYALEIWLRHSLHE